MKLKTTMLITILQNVDASNKYSKSFLNLKNVIELDKEDIKKDYVKKFNKIEKEYNKFLNNIPLSVIEKYLSLFKGDLNDFCYILYDGFEISGYTAIELYNLLEMFYSKLFFLASKIANYYNLEIKLNKDIEQQNNIKTI